MFYLKYKNNRGFTLIELLVVISIVSLLSVTILASLNVVREKGRDTKRITELKALANALELYKFKNGNYPNTNGLCSNSWCSGCSNRDGMSVALTPLVTEGFISKLPQDPTGDSSGGQCYNYEYISRPGITTGWICGGLDVGNYEYAIRFETERIKFNLPAFAWNRSPFGGEYCILPPR